MDAESGRALAHLIRTQRVAALGTIWDGAPLVSLVLAAAAPDFSSFYIHVSRLAQHTQAILQDARVSLMLAEPDDGSQNPQTLARLSLRGEALELAPTAADYDAAKSLYLAKFPGAAFNFGLGDFSLYRIRPREARYVGGFGKIFDLTAEDFAQVASLGPGL